MKSHSVIVSLTIPVVISTALFANEIVLIVLGPKWIEVAAVLRLLSPTVMVLALINPLGWLLRATGRVDRSLWIALLIAPVVILGVVVGLRHGPTGVALGYSTAMVVLAVPLIAWAKHGTGITTRDYWDAVKRPLISGVIGGAAGWLLHLFFRATLAPVPLLAIELVLSSGVYAGTLLFVFGQKDFYFELLGHLFRRGDQLTARS
jgi:O-antigen/teichoic acid export membrane protein